MNSKNNKNSMRKKTVRIAVEKQLTYKNSKFEQRSILWFEYILYESFKCLYQQNDRIIKTYSSKPYFFLWH